MPLMFYQGKPLIVDGKLAMHERCCCGCCPGLPTLTLEVSGGQGGGEWCAVFNGTYNLTPARSSTDPPSSTASSPSWTVHCPVPSTAV